MTDFQKFFIARLAGDKFHKDDLFQCFAIKLQICYNKPTVYMVAGLAFDSRLSRERLIVPAIVVPSFRIAILSII